jgi:osmotically-inducible protein OsmY
VIERQFGVQRVGFFSPLAKMGFEMKTDTQLKSDVTEELRWEPCVTMSHIDVNVHDGVVTLSGVVPTFAEKWAAQKATQRVEGVKAIAEELKVQPAEIHKHKQTEIAEAVVSSLKWHVWVPSQVQATVENGWVTLSGAVQWDFQRNSAADAVRYLAGVIGVSNNIILKPSLQPTAVKDAIEKALKRDAEIDADRITVSADGGKVILSGSSGSWHERTAAATAAWSAPGVTNVENNLHVLMS